MINVVPYPIPRMPTTEGERAEQSGDETIWQKNKEQFKKYDHSSQTAWERVPKVDVKN